MSVVFGILLFSFVIFMHELGHFTAAKAFGVQVNEFSMFMGPALWKKQIGETLYAIRLIPIGGYCAMEGEDGDSDSPRSFTSAAWWKRAIILVAGVTMNFIVGIILVGIFLAPSKQFNVPVVDKIEKGCLIAGENGIQKGDRFLEIDGEKIYTYSDVTMILRLNPGDVHDVTLLRDGERVELKEFRMRKRNFPEADGSPNYRYGFTFGQEKASFGALADYTWNTTVDNIRMVRLSLQMLLTGKAGLKDMTGPVGIVQQMSEVAESAETVKSALLSMVYFGGFISLNLGVMNLLPIPALDGGRLVGLLLTSAVEGVTKKKIDPKYEGYIHAAGMILLLALMAVILFKDIFVIIKG